MNLKNLIGFKERRYGFYVTLALAGLLLLSGIFYTAMFKSDYVTVYAQVKYNPAISVLLIVGGVITAVLCLLKWTKVFASYVGGIFALTALCLLISDIYLFVTNCTVKIDYFPEDLVNPMFLVPVLFVILTFVTGLVNCFLPQYKEVEACEEKTECCCGCCQDKEDTVDEK